MSAGKLIGAIIGIAVVAALAWGLMSGHLWGTLRALHMTHGVWIIGKIVIFAGQPEDRHVYAPGLKTCVLCLANRSGRFQQR